MLKACSRCGKIHPSSYKCNKGVDWNRGKNDIDKLRNTHKWHKKAEQIKEDAHYLCEYCLANGMITAGQLETHHIIKLQERPDLLLEDDNLICLCVACHKKADEGTIDAAELSRIARKRGQG